MKTKDVITVCDDLFSELSEGIDERNILYINCDRDAINKSLFYFYKPIINPNISKFVPKIAQKPDNLKFDYIYHLENVNRTFEFIVGEATSGTGNEKIKIKDKSIEISTDFAIILKSLELLRDSGRALFVVYNEILRDTNFKQLLKENGYSVNAVFNCSKTEDQGYFCSPYKIIIYISKIESEKTFIVNLDRNVKEILSRLNNNEQSNNFNTGIWLNFSEFKGFNYYAKTEMLTNLCKKYSLFKIYKIKDLLISKNKIHYEDVIVGEKQKMRMPNSKIDASKNSIYFEEDMNLFITDYTQLDPLKTYNQYIFNIEIIYPEYLKIFLNGNIGKKVIEFYKFNILSDIYKMDDFLEAETFNFPEGEQFPPDEYNEPNICEEYDFSELEIPVPDLNNQRLMIEINGSADRLINEINNLKQKIMINPFDLEVKPKIDQLLNYLSKLNEYNRILEILLSGENQKIEFKSTLRKPIENKNIPENDIEKAVLKTIAGFLNAHGGTLLVGINDHGEVLGLENDEFNSDDDLLKHVKNLIARDFKPKYYDLINYKILEFDSKRILVFDCYPSKEAVFIGKNSEDFYLRVGCATDKLVGEKQAEYIKTHFSN